MPCFSVAFICHLVTTNYMKITCKLDPTSAVLQQDLFLQVDFTEPGALPQPIAGYHLSFLHFNVLLLRDKAV